MGHELRPIGRNGPVDRVEAAERGRNVVWKAKSYRRLLFNRWFGLGGLGI